MGSSRLRFPSHDDSRGRLSEAIEYRPSELVTTDGRQPGSVSGGVQDSDTWCEVIVAGERAEFWVPGLTEASEHSGVVETAVQRERGASVPQLQTLDVGGWTRKASQLKAEAAVFSDSLILGAKTEGHLGVGATSTCERNIGSTINIAEIGLGTARSPELSTH